MSVNAGVSSWAGPRKEVLNLTGNLLSFDKRIEPALGQPPPPQQVLVLTPLTNAHEFKHTFMFDVANFVYQNR